MAKVQELSKSKNNQNLGQLFTEQGFQAQENIEFLSSESIYSSTEIITPEIAKAYLSTQKINRVPTRDRVQDYASRMIRGEWRISQPIQFTSEGDLFDGQHRLMAVIKSGIPCEFLVVRGMPPETRYYVDIGQNRKTSQIAQIMGVGTSLNTKLSTCKAMFMGKDLKPKNQKAETEAKGLEGKIYRSFSPHKLIELYLAHKESIDFADNLKAPATAPVRAVLARAWYHENHLRLSQFIQVLSTGFPVTPYDEAAIALRNVLINAKQDKQLGSSIMKFVLYKKTIAALSNFVANKNMRYIKEKTVELYPVPDFD